MTEPLTMMDILQSIANKRATRTPTDNQGKPLDSDAIKTAYVYDEHGLLTDMSKVRGDADE